MVEGSRLTGHVWLKVTLVVVVGGLLLGDGGGVREGSEGEESSERVHSERVVVVSD